MKNKLFLISIFLSLVTTSLKAQNYILNPYNLNVTGLPGDFLLSGLTVTNPNTTDIEIFISRIERTLPQGWTSCFCYPTCLAPWLDTLTWTIPAGTSVDISPNFQTTLTPGIGIVRVELLNLTTGSAADTITFTGSTLASGINEINSKIDIYPNPVADKIYIKNEQLEELEIIIVDYTGKTIYNATGDINSIPVYNFKPGQYSVFLKSKNYTYQKIVTVIHQ